MTRALRGTRIRIALAAVIAIGGAAGVMLLSGGASADGQKARVKSTDRWLPLAPSPLQRTEVGAARIGRFIYVLGGFVPTPSGATTSEVTRYDIDANEWTRVRSMPVGVNHPAVAAYKGSLYVHGGYTGLVTQPIDRLFRYTPATDTWVELKNSGRSRATHALVPIGDKLYAPGGADGQRAFRFLQLYDPARDRWRSGPAMRVAREHIGAAAVDGKLYVIAGRAGGLNLDVVERFDPDTRRWKRLRPVQVPRNGFQAAVVRGRIVAVGGEQLAEGDSTIGEVEILNPKTGRWRRLPSMLTPRHGVVASSQSRAARCPASPSRALLSSSISVVGDGLAFMLFEGQRVAAQPPHFSAVGCRGGFGGSLPSAGPHRRQPTRCSHASYSRSNRFRSVGAGTRCSPARRTSSGSSPTARRRSSTLSGSSIRYGRSRPSWSGSSWVP